MILSSYLINGPSAAKQEEQLKLITMIREDCQWHPCDTVAIYLLRHQASSLPSKYDIANHHKEL